MCVCERERERQARGESTNVIYPLLPWPSFLQFSYWSKHRTEDFLHPKDKPPPGKISVTVYAYLLYHLDRPLLHVEQAHPKGLNLFTSTSFVFFFHISTFLLFVIFFSRKFSFLPLSTFSACVFVLHWVASRLHWTLTLLSFSMFFFCLAQMLNSIQTLQIIKGVCFVCELNCVDTNSTAQLIFWFWWKTSTFIKVCFQCCSSVVIPDCKTVPNSPLFGQRAQWPWCFDWYIDHCLYQTMSTSMSQHPITQLTIMVPSLRKSSPWRRLSRWTVLIAICAVGMIIYMSTSCWSGNPHSLFDRRRLIMQQTIDSGQATPTCFFGRHHQVKSLLVRPMKHVAESNTIRTLTVPLIESLFNVRL